MTASEELGFVELKTDDKVYRLEFTFEAMEALEKHGMRWIARTQKELEENQKSIAEWFQNPSVARLRIMLWALLREHHEDVSFKEAGAIIQRTGWARVQPVVFEAFNVGRSKPDPAATTDPPSPSDGSSSGPSPTTTLARRKKSSGA